MNYQIYVDRIIEMILSNDYYDLTNELTNHDMLLLFDMVSEQIGKDFLDDIFILEKSYTEHMVKIKK